MKSSRLLSVLCLFCSLCLLLAVNPALGEGLQSEEPVIVYSRVYDYAVVTGVSKLNMRLGPAATYDWVGAAEPGDWVGILGEKDNWCYAYIPSSNQYGYMSKTYLLINGETGVPGEGRVAAARQGEKVHLHAFPSLLAQPAAAFDDGTPFQILSATADGWYEVEIDGQTGFLRSENAYVTQATGGVMAYLVSPGQGEILLRDRPFYTDAAVIGRFPSGTQAAVLLTTPAKDGFWKVSVSGLTGYVNGNFIQYDGVPAAAPVSQGSAAITALHENQCLCLRAQPSERARVLAHEPLDTELLLVNPGEVWSQVYDAVSQVSGYVQSRYLAVEDPAVCVRAVSGENVSLRLTESAAARTLLPVPDGAAVTVLVPGDAWCLVRYAGTVGYLPAEALK